MAENVHIAFHSMLDLVLRMSQLTARNKGGAKYVPLRVANNMMQVLDALLDAADIFDMACLPVSKGYKMKSDVISMKSQFGL
jgi:predicted kinase